MSNFYDRLEAYYNNIAKVLKYKYEMSKILTNPVDKGSTREHIYGDFISNHLPSKCNVIYGGFLFDEHGIESKQFDIIINSDTTPQFLLDKDKNSFKTFCPIEGTLGVVSIKSKLDKKELFKALGEFASLPPMNKNNEKLLNGQSLVDYENWPWKVLFAFDGIQGSTLLKYMTDFYYENKSIPNNRKVDRIHVLDKYLIVNTDSQEVTVNNNTGNVNPVDKNKFGLQNLDVNITGFNHVIIALQQNAAVTQLMNIDYSFLLNNLFKNKYPNYKYKR